MLHFQILEPSKGMIGTMLKDPIKKLISEMNIIPYPINSKERSKRKKPTPKNRMPIKRFINGPERDMMPFSFLVGLPYIITAPGAANANPSMTPIKKAIYNPLFEYVKPAGKPKKFPAILCASSCKAKADKTAIKAKGSVSRSLIILKFLSINPFPENANAKTSVRTPIAMESDLISSEVNLIPTLFLLRDLSP